MSSQKSRDSLVPSLLLLTLGNTGVLDGLSWRSHWYSSHLQQEIENGWRISPVLLEISCSNRWFGHWIHSAQKDHGFDAVFGNRKLATFQRNYSNT